MQTFKRFLIRLLKFFLYAIAGLTLVVTLTIQMCGDANYKGKLVNPLKPTPLTADTSPEGRRIQAVLAKIPNYKKGEEQTYLTIPEWYLVFNPNEYADFLSAGNNPSDFPFFQSINEYWTLYDRVIALTRNIYPNNSEYITMLRVIGISTTAEYLLKGAYENTIGRLTYWTASAKTPEDKLITAAQQAYAKLIYTKAWYEFPFSHWLGKMWRDTSFFGPNFIRKTERKLFFTLEFGIKTVYAKLIGLASATAYGPAVDHLTLVVKGDAASISGIDSRVSIAQDLGHGRLIITVPRWGAFSEIIPKLAEAGVAFIEISGNDDIAVSVLTDMTSSNAIGDAQFLFESKVFSPAHRKRLVYSVKVSELSDFIHYVVSHQMRLEHIFDY